MYWKSIESWKFLIAYLFLIDSLIGILLGINDLTNYMIFLTALLLPICILTTNSKILSNSIFLIGLILFGTFSTYNLLIWYIGFESIVIPMIYLLSKGSSSLLSRYRALYRFTLYTIVGGLLLLVSLLLLVVGLGSYNYYLLLLNSSISYNLQLLLFPLISISYLIKLPVIPFHIWLPDTHGEAPTSGSVLLAALLLKLGGIGFLRWLIPILPYGYLYYRPLLLLLGILSCIYASITTLRHIDIKKLIAYSSIAHMGFILIGIISFSSIALKGTLLLLVSHGFVSSLLFLLIGSLYVRTGTRILFYYRGLANTMPLFSIFLFISLLLNASIPPSLSFFAELLILEGSFLYEIIGISSVLLGVLLSGIYSIILFCKITFSKSFLISTKDLTLREFSILSPLIVFSFLFSFWL